MTNRKTKAITQEEIQEAVKAFQKNGGLTHHLPDQITPVRQLIGGKWASLESLIEPYNG